MLQAETKQLLDTEIISFIQFNMLTDENKEKVLRFVENLIAEQYTPEL